MNVRKIILVGIPVLIGGLIIIWLIVALAFSVSLQGGRITTYNWHNSELSAGSVDSIAFDEQGRAWIGTYCYDACSVSIFDGEAWTSLAVPGARLAVEVIAFDEQGRAWIGSQGGVNVFDGGAWTNYTPGNSGLPDRFVDAIVFDEQGRAWIGTSSGVSVFDGETWTTYTAGNSGLAEGSVFAIAFDERGRAWIGVKHDVSVFDGETWTTYTPGNSRLTGGAIEAIAFDEQGRAWIGTRFGVCVFDGETWMTYTADNSGLVESSVSAITFDERGRAWIGNEHGVDVFDGKTWTAYTVDESFPGGSPVEVIVFDERGYAWIGTLSGVSVFPPDEATSLPQPLAALRDYWVYLPCFSPVVFAVPAGIWLVALLGRGGLEAGKEQALQLWRVWANRVRARKIILWGIPFLIGGLVVTCFIAELAREVMGEMNFPTTSPYYDIPSSCASLHVCCITPAVSTVLAGIWLVALLDPGRLEAKKEQTRVDRRIWLWCVLANTVGLVISYLAAFAVLAPRFAGQYAQVIHLHGIYTWAPFAIGAGIAGGGAGSVVIGVIQWLAWRRHVPRAARWVLLDAAGFAASYAVTAVLATLWYAFWTNQGKYTAIFILVFGCGLGIPIGGVFGAVTGIVAGIIRGLAQCLVLWRPVFRSVRWILVGSAGLAIGLIASGAIMPIALTAIYIPSGEFEAGLTIANIGVFLGMVPIVAAGGAVGGMFSGHALIRWLRHATPETPGSDQAPPDASDSSQGEPEAECDPVTGVAPPDGDAGGQDAGGTEGGDGDAR